jgi:hypothetical protein
VGLPYVVAAEGPVELGREALAGVIVGEGFLEGELRHHPSHAALLHLPQERPLVPPSHSGQGGEVKELDVDFPAGEEGEAALLGDHRARRALQDRAYRGGRPDAGSVPGPLFEQDEGGRVGQHERELGDGETPLGGGEEEAARAEEKDGAHHQKLDHPLPGGAGTTQRGDGHEQHHQQVAVDGFQGAPAQAGGQPGQREP